MDGGAECGCHDGQLVRCGWQGIGAQRTSWRKGWREAGRRELKGWRAVGHGIWSRTDGSVGEQHPLEVLECGQRSGECRVVMYLEDKAKQALRWLAIQGSFHVDCR